MDLEIPLGKRTKKYRFFEILPGFFSYGAIILLIVLSIFDPLLASIYLLIIILSTLVRSIGICYQVVGGRSMMEKASNTDWNRLLTDLDNPKAAYDRLKKSNRKIKNIFYKRHMENLRLMSTSKDGFFPKASDLYNTLIMPAYNESIEVIEPALKSVVDTTYDKKHLIIVSLYKKPPLLFLRAVKKVQKKQA